MKNSDGEDDVELMNDVEIAESEDNSENCDDVGSENCDAGSVDSVNVEAINDEEEATVEEEIPEKQVVSEKPVVTLDLKAGRTCRLKTEGEKLSKIIRKAGKAQQKLVEKEIVQPKEKAVKKVIKVQPSEKLVKVKRDTRAQETVNSKNRKQQKEGKKTVSKSGSNSKKKSSSGKKKNFKSQKSSKKTQRNKKASKNEL